MDSIGDHKIHPAANIFPMMDESALADLVEDIRKHGLETPITEWQGQIIDGRNRLIACDRLGIEPTIAEIEDEKLNVVAFVLSLNLHRRHLTDSQRAMVAARIKDLYKPAAKERQKNGGGDKKSRKSKEESVGENLPQPIGGPVKVRDEAGKALAVSGRSVDHATTVIEKGSPELVAAVDKGEVSVSKAATIAKTTPPAKQIEAATSKPAKAPRAPKPKSVLKELKALYQQASAEDRSAFLEWIDSGDAIN